MRSDGSFRRYLASAARNVADSVGVPICEPRCLPSPTAPFRCFRSRPIWVGESGGSGLWGHQLAACRSLSGPNPPVRRGEGRPKVLITAAPPASGRPKPHAISGAATTPAIRYSPGQRSGVKMRGRNSAQRADHQSVSRRAVSRLPRTGSSRYAMIVCSRVVSMT